MPGRGPAEQTAASLPPRSVVVTRNVRVPVPTSRAVLAGTLALVVLAYAGLVVSAVVGSAAAFAVLALGVAAAEVLLAARAPAALWGAREVQLATPWRWAVQGAAALVLAGVRGAGRPTLALLLAALLVLSCAVGLLAAAGEALRYLRKSPLLARGLDLGDLSLPAPAPRWVARPEPVLAPLQLVTVLAAAATAARWWPLGAGVGVLLAVIVLGLVPVVVAAGHLLRTWRARPRQVADARVRQALDELAPQVLLYYGGGPHALYQVQTWLRVLERSPLRTLVVLRDPESLRRLAPTTLPAVSAVSNALLMTLALPSARAALFVANAANNAHLIRRREVRTAFIGHGDSDKFATTSPFLKAYDEIWVAGPAGAARMADMGTPGLLGRVREVGRPQAPFLAPGSVPRSLPGPGPGPGPGSVPASSVRTVLYAPTWEGWGDEEFTSSLQHGGVELVRRLLATSGVRLAYRPHPLTGSRDRSTRRAHQQVLALLAAAGAAVTAPTQLEDMPDEDHGDGLDDLALMLSRCRTAAAPDAGSPRLESGVPTDPDERRWADSERPLVSSGDRPSLLSCFTHSDLLVADVSSIVSDWLALDRPYALMVPPDQPFEGFVQAHPTAAAAALVGADCSGLDGLLTDLAQGRDPRGAQRRALREDLLGSPPEGAQQRFDAALRHLVSAGGAGDEIDLGAAASAAHSASSAGSAHSAGSARSARPERKEPV